MIWLFIICWALWAMSRLSLTASRERAPSLLARIPHKFSLWGQITGLLVPVLVLAITGNIHDLFLWGYCGPVIIVMIVFIRAWCPALPIPEQPPQEP